MNRLKAIKVLKSLVDSYVDYANITMKEEDDDIADALEMAVEALKTLDVPDTNVGDMISRRAAIDAVKKNTFRLTFAEEQNCEGHVAWSAYAVYSDVIEGALLELPSAQPEQKWIQCSERLPREGQKCLVYDKVVGYRVDTYIGHGTPFNWELFVRDYEAWMSLPEEPYRG